VSDIQGSCSLIEGPRRVWTTFATIRFLTFHRASKKEYLEVEFKDGRREIWPGPVTLFENPVEHSHVRVKPAIQLSSSEAIVIYTDCRPSLCTHDAGALSLPKGKGQSASAAGVGVIDSVLLDSWTPEGSKPSVSTISRRILHGPALYVPLADEWLHQFSWTCEHEHAPLSQRESKNCSFVKLDLAGDAMHYTVKHVRTSDEASLDLSFVVTLHPKDINKMLDCTSDPKRDLALALTSDVLEFGSQHSLQGLLDHSSALCRLDTMRRLLERATDLGFGFGFCV